MDQGLPDHVKKNKSEGGRKFFLRFFYENAGSGVYPRPNKN